MTGEGQQLGFTIRAARSVAATKGQDHSAALEPSRKSKIQCLCCAVVAFLVGYGPAGCAATADKQGGVGSSATRSSAPEVTIVLVGDSTVEDYLGWGPGFRKLLKPEVRCINWAKGGRSSKSFINEGWWKKALACKPTYVLIQFGHNDMPGKGVARETDPATTYPETMSRYVDEARSAGAEPILITSMTRRRFGSDGKIHSDLTAYVEAVKRVARAKKVPLIDLHARSIELLDRLGPEASREFDPIPKSASTQPASTRPAGPDRTHLSPKGAEIMGRLVADELKKVEPRLAGYIK